MSPRREFSGTSVSTTLASDITSSATTIPLAAVTGWPTGPDPAFAVIRSGATEEKITFTGISGTSLTGVTRAQDGTSAAAWSTGATVEHVWTATDAEDSNRHIFDTTQDEHTQYIPRTGTRGFTGTGSIAGTPAVVLGTAAAPGSANTLLRTDATIVAFDATVPARNGTAAAGVAAVAARRDHVHPGNTLTYNQITADIGPASSETIAITATAVTIAAGMRIKITAYFPEFDGTNQTDIFEVRIKEGATLLQRIQRNIPAGGFGDGGEVVWVGTPTAASHTYTVTFVRISGTGTGTLRAAATSPAFILVEAIGV